MRIAVGDGVELFVDVDGPEWVPDGPRMRRRPTLILLHGGPGMDHSAFKCELAELGIESPVVMGQSFGGFVAQSYAIRHPEHPSALILSSTSPRKNLPRNLAVFQRLGGAKARGSAEAFYADPIPEKFGDFLRDRMSLYNRRFSDPDGMRRSVLRGEVLFHFFQHEYGEFDFLPALGKVRCPDEATPLIRDFILRHGREPEA